MKHVLLITLLVLGVAFGTSARAACFVEYKAKQDNPLRLEYGVTQVDEAACSDAGARQQAVAQVQAALAQKGWKLLKVLSVSDSSGSG